MAETVSYQPFGGNPATGTLVVAVNLGNVNGTLQRIIIFDLLVSLGILGILTIVAVAVVRANLRPLDDIELTAGQIAAGHLDHRVPERDPRTEVGSLGRSLNTMLSQIETAFHAREESEDAAHRSEERMRRFIADASHELRTPLTTIRGFAEYYRQRGGAKKISALQLSAASPSPAALPRRNWTGSWRAWSPRHRGWGCSWRTCFSSPGWTSSGRWRCTRSTCSPWRPTPCRTPGLSRRTVRPT